MDFGLYAPHPRTVGGKQYGQQPCALGPLCLEKFRLQQKAAKATAEADGDRRLRRRCYGSSLGNLAPLALAIFASTGEIPLPGSNVKLRWRDPAMCDHEGAWAIRPQQRVYWLGHGTVLLRAAPEHVKPTQVVPDLSEKAADPLHTTRQVLQNIRQRGVTHYIDLQKTNKRR